MGESTLWVLSLFSNKNDAQQISDYIVNKNLDDISNLKHKKKNLEGA